MLTLQRALDSIAVVVPVYFEPSLGRNPVRDILEETFLDHAHFCRPDRTLIVVDRATTAEAVLLEAPPRSPLHGYEVHVLPENRGKAGAICAGLARLLEKTSAPFLVTRDCDGDHMPQDLPALATAAVDLQQDTSAEKLMVFGARTSLEKPMGWVRQQWETWTNSILADLVEFLLAQQERILDRRYWGSLPLDLQSGYRLYSREAAREAVVSLSRLPEDPRIYTFACEMAPFVDLALQGALIGQIRRHTMVEQPVSSFESKPLAECYSALLNYVFEQHSIPAPIVVCVLDNHLFDTSLYFSPLRDEVLKFRQLVLQDAPAPQLPRFL